MLIAKSVNINMVFRGHELINLSGVKLQIAW